MKTPLISVVIATYNQAERLALVLQGLEVQTLGTEHFEIVVVDDGCTDGTQQVVEQAAAHGLPGLRLIGMGANRGRSAARNLGIAQAAGELILFLDGDALPAPDLLELYSARYDELGSLAVLCGFQYCIADLEHVRDPQVADPRTDIEMPSVLFDYLQARRDSIAVTAEMVRRDFDAIHARACPGGYPFAESARRQDEVVELLSQSPGSPVGWLGFIPHNGAVAARQLRAVGGFDETIPFCEGWELAYRLLQQPGASCSPVPASTYHLYHHHRFSDLDGARQEGRIRYRAIEHMATQHGDARVRLIYFWLAHLWDDLYIPDAMVVRDLLQFDHLYSGLSERQWREYELVLRNHPAQFPLSATEVKYGSCA